MSFAYILVKIFFNVDLQKTGSGNLGAANSINVGGIKTFILIFILDFLKGYMPLYIVSKFMDIPYIEYVAAVGIIIGHNYSIFLKFHGGKGLASLVGIIFFMNVYVLIIGLIIAAIICILTRIPNFSAAVAVMVYPFLNTFFSKDFIVFLLSMIITIPVIIKHKNDLIALRNH